MEATQKITSLTNAKIKQWAKYKEKKYREQDRRFLIEGEHLIQEAHRANLIEYILVEEGTSHGNKDYVTFEVTKDILKKLSDSVSGTSCMAVCHYPDADASYGQKVIVLDDLQDPGNVGTIIRTAHSFGFDSVVLSSRCVDVFNDKVIRSTQGALFHMPIIRGELPSILGMLRAQGTTIYATALQRATPLQAIEVATSYALVFGNEGSGVSAEVLALSDERVYIEMDTFESLNVAVASAICMYYFKHK